MVCLMLLLVTSLPPLIHSQSMTQVTYYQGSSQDCSPANFLFDITTTKSTCTSESICVKATTYATYSAQSKCTSVLPTAENSPGHLIYHTYSGAVCTGSVTLATRVKLGVCWNTGWNSIIFESCGRMTTYTDTACKQGALSVPVILDKCIGVQKMMCNGVGEKHFALVWLLVVLFVILLQ